MKKKKILLFGGTFSPIHHAHLIIARNVAEQMEMDKVVFIPNGIPPHKKISVNPIYKYEMIKLAIQGEPLFDTTTYEMNKKSKSYTIETIRHFKHCLGNTIDKLYWLIGPDITNRLHTWYKIDELAEECVFICCGAVERIPRYRIYEKINIRYAELPALDIRSTNIRKRVSKGLSIKYLVPNAVENYIKLNKLYSK